MNFLIIDPTTRTIRNFDAKDYKDALKEAELESGGIDFGTIAKQSDGSSYSIMVYEYGLMKPKTKSYFSILKQLYNGTAIVFRANDEGETIDVPLSLAAHWATGECPDFQWLSTADEAEKAIEDGKIIRPQSSINGEVLWQWKGTD